MLWVKGGINMNEELKNSIPENTENTEVKAENAELSAVQPSHGNKNIIKCKTPYSENTGFNQSSFCTSTHSA